MEQFKIGEKVSFRDSDGAKHYGVIDSFIPNLLGGGIYSVRVPALGRYMTVSEPEKIKRKVKNK